MKKQNQDLRIEEEKDLAFLHPAYGPDTYVNVGKEIEQAGLKKPTMAETASLVYDVFFKNLDNKYSNEIKKMMKEGWLWGFTGTLYVPNKGAYIQDYPEIRKGMPFMDEKDLEGKLKAGDKTVRFVPFGYKNGEMSVLELAKNDYLKALVGEEGAAQLTKVAGKYKYKPFLLNFKSVNKPLTRVSSIVSGWDLHGRRLVVDGDFHGNDGDGWAFGIQKIIRKKKKK